MSPALTTFLFEAANFLLLAGLLGWFFFQPVRRMLAEQRKRIDAAEQNAQQQLAEAEKTRDEIEQRRKALHAELDKLRSEELQAARRKADEIVEEARTAAAREREVQSRQAARRAETEAAQFERAATSAAAEVVSRLLRQIDGPDLQSALLQAACRQLQTQDAVELSPIRVESAVALSPNERAEVEAAAGLTAGESGRRIDWHVSRDLGPGVRIATAAGVIDATADGLAHFALRALRHELNHRRRNSEPLG
ncbi:MAG: ATP synthase F0 subunit B [Pirellulaceae bacterium]